MLLAVYTTALIQHFFTSVARNVEYKATRVNAPMGSVTWGLVTWGQDATVHSHLMVAFLVVSHKSELFKLYLISILN